MKVYNYYLVFAFLLFHNYVLPQDRGAKPTKINIEGESIELYSGSYALVIGNSNYEHWSNLPGVKEDIKDVENALKRHGFKVISKENLDKNSLDRAFSEFIRDYGNDKNNRLLFYFAGHGHTIKSSYGDKFGYIVPVNSPNPIGNKSYFKDSAIPMSRIVEYAKSIESKHALFLFDACFSGNLINVRGGNYTSEDIKYSYKLPIRYFITSGTDNETVPDKSIFCEELVTALTTGQADLTKDGFLTSEELGIYLQSKVINYSNGQQHPQKGPIRNNKLDKGNFIFELPNRIKKNVIKPEKPTEKVESVVDERMRYTEIFEDIITNYARQIQFDTGTNELNWNSRRKISDIAKILKEFENLVFIVEGHTDSVGDKPVNQKLSEERAQIVRNLLIEEGVDASKLKAIGYGEGNPIASNKFESGRKENRRIEIRLPRN